MKIVHVYWGLCYGGIETMMVNIANCQVADGHSVDIIIINDGMIEPDLRAELRPEIAVHELHRRRHSKSLAPVVRFNRLLRQLRPDAIHLQGSRFFTMVAGSAMRRRCTVTIHDMPTGVIRRGLAGRLLPITDLCIPGNVVVIDKAPRVCAISRSVADDLQSKYGVSSTVVSNGIATARFRRRPAGRPAPGFTPESPLRIVQVSRLESYKKGQDVLIRAVARLGGCAVVDLVGDGSSRAELETLARELGADKWVRFLGKQPQEWVAERLADYDLFVHASRIEGFGLTVAEALSAGLPVIVTRGDGPAEVTCGDRYASLIEPGDDEGLARAISDVAADYSGALAKAEQGRRHVADTYDVSITARRYCEMYVSSPVTTSKKQ